MSFPPNSFTVNSINYEYHDTEWILECDRCTNRYITKGMLHKIITEPEDLGWTLEKGDIVCNLCNKEKEDGKN